MTEHTDNTSRRVSTAFNVSMRMKHLKNHFSIPPEIHFGIIHKLLQHDNVLQLDDDEFIKLMKTTTYDYIKNNISCVSLYYVDSYVFDGNHVREEYIKLLEYIDHHIDCGGKYGTFIEMDETVNIVMTEKQFNTMKLCEKDMYETLCEVIDHFKGIVYTHIDDHKNQYKIIRFYDLLISMRHFNDNNVSMNTRDKIIDYLKDNSNVILL